MPVAWWASLRPLKKWSYACGILLLAATTSSAQISIGGGVRVDGPFRSMKALREQNVVIQRFDFSCGAAALATLLHYGFGANITERDVMAEMFLTLPEDEKAVRRRTGFSLLDLQRVAQAKGYSAEGFRLEPHQLRLLGGPVIVFIEPRGYRHFAVLRGIQGDRAYLADPSRGNIRMPIHAFVDSWLQDDGKGIIFVVEPPDGPPQKTMPLSITREGLPLPEIMSARELLAIGNPLLR